MSILHFLAYEGRAPRSTILAMAGISGAMNVAMLELVNSAAEHAALGALDTRLLLLYVIAFAVYVVTQHYARTRSVAAINGALQRLRLRLADRCVAATCASSRSTVESAATRPCPRTPGS